MTKAGDKILAGAKAALAHARGDESQGRARMIINSVVDVKEIRERLNMTQQKFADTYGLSLHSLKKWEAGTRNPEGAAKAYLTVIAQRPNVVRKALAEAI